MLNSETKRKIQSARDILVGKVPDPKSQVEQITLALMFKFMDDMDKDAMALGAKAKFFSGEFAEYSWSKILDSRLGAQDRLNLYAEALGKMNQNPNIPQLFRDIFKNALLPYRDPETLTLFLKQINEFTYSHSEQLGDAFEFLLSRMASQGDAGQFRTPRHIIDFIVAVVDPDKNQSVLDPACGTAGFLISAYKYVLERNKEKGLTPDEKGFIAKNFVGYDISPDMVRLSLVNMYLHGFADPQIHEYDSLSSTTRWEDKYDVILANPPFMTPKGGIKPHKRFGIQAHRSEVLFVDYILEHLSIRGKAGIIVPEGIIFKSENAYKQLRKKLVEDGLYCVVSLPAGVFQPYSGVKTSILLFDNEISKHTKNLLFVKIENDGYDLGAQRRQQDDHFGDLTEAKKTILEYKEFILTGNTHNNLFLERIRDNEKIGETVSLTHDKFSVVAKDTIAESGDYNLSGDRYKIQNIITNQKWPMVELQDVLDYEQPTKYLVSSVNYSNEYKTPVLTAGKTFILGYTDEKEGVYSEELPVIIFDDFTTESKLVNFPFKVKSSAMKILHAKKEKINIDYAFYMMRGIKFNHDTHKRYWISEYSKTKIPLPPLEIQQQIVDELDGYQKIISGAKQVVEKWRPRIEIRSDWEKVKIEDVCEIKGGKRIPKGKTFPNSITEYPYIRVADFEEGSVNLKNLKYITKEIFEEIKRYTISTEDVYISIAGTIGLIGTIPSELDGKSLTENAAKLVIKDRQKINKDYLSLVLQSDDAQRQIKNLTHGVGVPKLGLERIAKIEVSIPSIEIQNQIVKEVEKERNLVDGNKKLIEIYEQKIKSKIAEVWGEE